MKNFRVFLYVLIAAVLLGGAVMIGGTYMIACTSSSSSCAGSGEKCGSSTSDNRACCEGLRCNNHGIGQGYVCEDY